MKHFRLLIALLLLVLNACVSKPPEQSNIKQAIIQLKKQLELEKAVANYLKKFPEIKKHELIQGEMKGQGTAILILWLEKPLTPDFLAEIKQKVSQMVPSLAYEVSVFQRRIKVAKP